MMGHGMRVALLTGGIVACLFCGPAAADDNCSAIALVSVRAQEDPSSTIHKGNTVDAVNEYKVDKKTGMGVFCSHGGLCYPRYVTVHGRKLEALRLTDCKIGARAPEDRGDQWTYAVGAASAAANDQSSPLSSEAPGSPPTAQTPPVDQSSATASIAHPGAFLAKLGWLVGVIAVVGLAIYFLPSMVALRRHKRNVLAIFILNLFVGWTFFGWVGALIWSVLREPAKPATGRERPWMN
jgi:hypothetical protein